MFRLQHREAASLEGHRLSVALRDGSRVDDCQLVSAGRGTVRSLWVYTNGADAFLSIDDIVAIWEVAA
jgi:hypothetical protein